MLTKNKMRYLSIYLIFFGCTTKDKTNSIEIEQDIFKIHINAIVPEDDIFEVFYLDQNLSEKVRFTKDKKLREKIVGSKTIQKITFKLPNKIYPYQFRLDLGGNRNQQEIIIKSIELSYRNGSIIINSDLIRIFFIINQFIDLNDSNGKIKLKEISQSKDPFIIARPILLKKMEIEL